MTKNNAKPQKDRLLRIGQLANMAGVSAPTIKHYVKEGLLPRPVKTSRNMAYYDESCVERINLIKRIQKERFLPPIAKAEVMYCQGWSEPNAGSDLASLTTKAVQDGDDYIINGQKIWTSGAHRADMMFTLVRTNPNEKRGKGLTYLLLDMKTPGITIRPIEKNNRFFNLKRTI